VVTQGEKQSVKTERLNVRMNEEEIWKDIDGYEGIYQVSNMGRVKSLERLSIQKHLVPEKILNGFIHGYGYPVVDLYKDGVRKRYYVHRLVATAFVPNPRNLNEVDHLDRNTSNCRADNLRWCTHVENYENPLTKEHERKVHTGIPLKESARKKLEKPISVFRDGKHIHTFNSYFDLNNSSKQIIGERLWDAYVRKVIRGEIDNYKGYTFQLA